MGYNKDIREVFMVIHINDKCTCCSHPTDVGMDIESDVLGKIRIYIQDHSSGQGRIVVDILELRAALLALAEIRSRE
jgi:hypothetical protein